MAQINDTVLVSIVGGGAAIFAALVSAVVAFFGGKGSAYAAVTTSQTALMQLVNDSLERDRDHCQKELTKMTGRLAGLEQYNISLLSALRKNGIEDIPQYRPVEVVFLPEKDHTNG